MDQAKRVATNTGFLYGKMIITIFISLYSTRLILLALGVEDFGVYNLVGGVIGMLSFLNAAMAGSTQRYISYYLGVGKINELKSVFSSSVVLHLLIGVIVVVFLEIMGIFLFDSWLNIPEARIHSAKYIFHFMVISTFFTINAVPYDATINAHQNMLLDAVFGVFESFVKLGIAIWVVYTSMEKLILYGILIASLTIFIRFLKGTYCIKKYEECTLNVMPSFNMRLFKEMLGFSGWNFLGFFSNAIRDQGLAIVLNVYIGVVINAAYGIANQVNGQLNAFSSNINKALKPQIVQSEGGGDRKRMLRLAVIACKVPFLLMAFFAVPLIIEMPFVLKIWLKNVPDYAAIFCQLLLIVSMVQLMTWGLSIAIHSVGKIGKYQFTMSLLVLLNLPLAIFAIIIGLPPYFVLILSLVLEIISGIIRTLFAKRLTGLQVQPFFTKTIFRSVTAILLAYFLAKTPSLVMDEGFLRLGISILLSSLLIIAFSWTIALEADERSKISSLMLSAKKALLLKLKIGK